MNGSSGSGTLNGDAIANATARGYQAREAIVVFIETYMAEHGWSPSYQEIADELHLVDRGTVHSHLHRLEREGRIVLGGGPRMIRVRNSRSGG